MSLQIGLRECPPTPKATADPPNRRTVSTLCNRFYSKAIGWTNLVQASKYQYNVYTERLKGVEVSKKDKSKFRRRLKAQILQDMANVQAGKPASTTPAPKASTQPIVSPKIETAKPVTAPTSEVGLPVGASLDTLQLVRHDLKKSAIIIGSIIIIIVGLYFIDQKTGILLKAGNEIFKVLRIGS